MGKQDVKIVGILPDKGYVAFFDAKGAYESVLVLLEHSYKLVVLHRIIKRAHFFLRGNIYGVKGGHCNADYAYIADIGGVVLLILFIGFAVDQVLLKVGFVLFACLHVSVIFFDLYLVDLGIFQIFLVLNDGFVVKLLGGEIILVFFLVLFVFFCVLYVLVVLGESLVVLNDKLRRQKGKLRLVIGKVEKLVYDLLGQGEMTVVVNADVCALGVSNILGFAIGHIMACASDSAVYGRKYDFCSVFRGI